jgi:hypothetical protein
MVKSFTWARQRTTKTSKTLKLATPNTQALKGPCGRLLFSAQLAGECQPLSSECAVQWRERAFSFCLFGFDSSWVLGA